VHARPVRVIYAMLTGEHVSRLRRRGLARTFLLVERVQRILLRFAGDLHSPPATASQECASGGGSVTPWCRRRMKAGRTMERAAWTRHGPATMGAEFASSERKPWKPPSGSSEKKAPCSPTSPGRTAWGTEAGGAASR